MTLSISHTYRSDEKIKTAIDILVAYKPQELLVVVKFLMNPKPIKLIKLNVFDVEKGNRLLRI